MMERRTFIKTAGSIAAATAAGGGALLAFSGGAAAASELDISGASVATDDGDVTEVIVTLAHEATWDGFDIPVEAVEYRDEIVVTDADGNEVGSTVLRDGLSSPVLLENFSSDGSGSDGWGGADEYTSGPGTAGSVNAGIQWTILHDTPSDATYPPAGDGSVGAIGEYGLDNPTDGSTVTYTVEYRKTVQFYTADSAGEYTTDDGTTVRLLGDDDGTIAASDSSGTFTLDVTNEPATKTGSGDGGAEAS